MIPQTAIQKVVALQDLADDLHAEIRTLRQRAERADDLLTEIRTLRQRAERAERILAALREPSDAVVNVAWEHMDIIRAAVAAAEKEVDA